MFKLLSRERKKQNWGQKFVQNIMEKFMLGLT